MPNYVFAYRIPNSYQPGKPGATGAWVAWFKELGSHVADRGNPVFSSTTLGESGSSTSIGGYSLVTADDLESAVSLAKGCPALAVGGGVEVGEITELLPA